MTEVGSVYGGALFDLAADEGVTLEILGQLQVLSESFLQEPAFVKLLSAHSLAKKERCKIVDESFAGKVHPFSVRIFKKFST